MEKQIHEVSVVHRADNELGEGPLWLNNRNALYWVDIGKHQIYEYSMSGQKVRNWKINRPVSLLIETGKEDTLLVGLQGGLALFSLETSELSELIALEGENENSRTNDGGCDPNGNLWIGTLDIDFKEGAGALYMLKGSTFEKKIPHTTIANGLVWSKDRKYMYFIDSPKGCVDAFLYNGEDNSIVFQRKAVIIPKSLGSPDGMAIDEEGMLWVAHYGGFSVGRWDPNSGELLEKIELPVPNVTACTFGGNDLKTLFITTARQELTDEELLSFPLSGALFSLNTAVRGIAKNTYSMEKINGQ